MTNKLTSIKQRIARLDDAKDLRKLSTYIRQREKIVATRSHERNKTEAWNRAKTWKQARNGGEGTRVFCCVSGQMLGGNIQRGVEWEVWHVQPRVERVWLCRVRDGKPDSYRQAVGMKPSHLIRYNVRETHPDNPYSEEAVDRIDKIFTPMMNRINESLK